MRRFDRDRAAPGKEAMKTRRLFGLVAGLVPIVFGSPAVPAAEPEATPSRRATEEIGRDYSLQHPEVILESLREMEERQRVAPTVKKLPVRRSEREISGQGVPDSG
jgi:hypothetical protein